MPAKPPQLKKPLPLFNPATVIIPRGALTEYSQNGECCQRHNKKGPDAASEPLHDSREALVDLDSIQPENGFLDRRAGWSQSERGERLPKAAHRVSASESIYRKGFGFCVISPNHFNHIES